MPIDSPAETEPWTILRTLHWTVDHFKKLAIETPRIDAEILLAHTLGCKRIDLYLRHDQPLNGDELSRFKGLIRRRLAREPVAYITGIKEFWSLPFAVTPAVLIPRPDTECLVDTAISLLTGGGFQGAARILELGVGSGAITVALAHELRKGFFLASDRSRPAIELARGNARRNGVDHLIGFIVGDWMAPFAPGRAMFDMIVTNPPYIPAADLATVAEEIRNFEPIAALDGGPEGLDAIKTILAQSQIHLRRGGFLLMEIGYDQRPALEHQIRHLGGYSSVTFVKDYGGHDRVAVVCK